MELKNTVEYLYLALMMRWESTAPKDNHLGELDGEPARNSQANRLAFILNKIAAGNVDSVFNALSMTSRRRDGKSNITKDSSWMLMPTALLNGWCLEGTLNLIQKQDIVQGLTKVGISPALISIIDIFVAGNSIKKLIPSTDEEVRMLNKMHQRGELDEDDFNLLMRCYSKE